jgi:hypothetical protein
MAGRPRIYETPVREILLGAGADGMTMTDLLERVRALNPSATRIGLSYALRQLFDEGVVARIFEWTYTERGTPRARVYRYFLANLADRNNPDIEFPNTGVFQTPVAGFNSWNWGR